MAIHDLEVIVEVDISSALTALADLQDELEDVADAIRRVDARGEDGISVQTTVYGIESELTRLQTKIELWEEANSIQIGTDTDDFDPNYDAMGDRIRNSVRNGFIEAFDSEDINISDGVDDEIYINTNVYGIESELSDLTAKIEAWEASNRINIETEADEMDVASGNLGDQLRNSMRAGFIDALQSEDVSILGGGGDGDTDINLSEAGARGGAAALRRSAGRPDTPDMDPREVYQPFMDARSSRFGRLLMNASDSLDGFIENSRLTNLSMSDIHNALARILPLLLVFVGTIPALIAAFVTLAAAAFAAAASLAAITAFGAMGVAMEGGEFNMQNLTDVWSDIRESFIEAFAPLANRLEPIFEDAVDGLDRFFQLVANEGDALMSLTDEARDFGSWIMGFVPDALRALAGLVEAFAPTFGDIGAWIDRNFNSVVRGAVEITSEALPAIGDFIGIIMQMIPALVRLSIGFTVVATAVLRFFDIIGRVLAILPMTTEQFGVMVAAALAVASAFFLLNSSVAAFAFNSLVALGKNVLAAISALTSYNATAIISTLSTYGLATAFLFLIGVITLGLGAMAVAGSVAATMGDKFSSAAGDIQGAASALDNYDSVASGVGGSGFNPYGGGGSSGQSGAGTTINYESHGSQNERDNARYLSWRSGRTSGSRG